MPRLIHRSTVVLLISLLVATLLMVLNQMTLRAVSAEKSIQPRITPSACLQPPTTTTPILAIYVLAFDNDPTITNTFNLSYQYTATVQSIANATISNSDAQAVILADLDSDNDTHILSIVNGSVNALDCLPNIDAELVETINEFDTTDGATLGAFFEWASITYPATRTIVSYIGHGTFFVPDSGTPIAELVEASSQRGVAKQSPTTLSPLPSKLDFNAYYTDQHVPTGSPDYIKPHDLAVALARLTRSGEFPVDVLDLVHCFAASAEEFYELHEYADYTTGSPNYAWYGPDMPGEALSNFASGDTSEDLAFDILSAYDSIIPADSQHPSALVAVENSEMANVKVALDDVATFLIEEFNSDPIGTVNRIDNAYINSRKYDTTFCEDPADLELAPPDELSDIHSFFEQMGSESFSQGTLDKITTLFSAIETSNGPGQLQKVGAPHFYEGMGMAPTWNFSEEPYYSLYTPFDVWTSADGTTYHSWQSLWYSSTTVYEIDGSTTISNPHPFRLLQPNGEKATWADVIARYWHEVSERPGVDVDTAFCGQPLRGFRQPLIRMQLSTTDDADPISTGETIRYTIGVTNSGPSSATQLAIVHQLSPLMQFTESTGDCFINGSALVCPIGTLPPNESATYTIYAFAHTPGVATLNSEISVLQRIAPTMTSETTTITGSALAVGVAQAQASTTTQPIAILVAVLTVTMALLLGRQRRGLAIHAEQIGHRHKR